MDEEKACAQRQLRKEADERRMKQEAVGQDALDLQGADSLQTKPLVM